MHISGRLLCTTKQLGLAGDKAGRKNQQYSSRNIYSLRFRCLNKGGLGDHVEKKAVVAAKAIGTAVVSETMTQNWKISDVSLVADNVLHLILHNLENFLKLMPQKLYHLQSFIGKGILDCQFFSLFAVAGTLIGSLLCFVEGCYLIIDSYVHYYIAISQNSDLGHMVQLLIEAIDMFLLGTEWDCMSCLWDQEVMLKEINCQARTCFIFTHFLH